MYVSLLSQSCRCHPYWDLSTGWNYAMFDMHWAWNGRQYCRLGESPLLACVVARQTLSTQGGIELPFATPSDMKLWHLQGQESSASFGVPKGRWLWWYFVQHPVWISTTINLHKALTPTRIWLYESSSIPIVSASTARETFFPLEALGLVHGIFAAEYRYRFEMINFSAVVGCKCYIYLSISPLSAAAV